VGRQHWGIQELLAEEDGDDGSGVDGGTAGIIVNCVSLPGNTKEARFAVRLDRPWELVFSKKCIVFEGNGGMRNASGAHLGLTGRYPF
jgi:hypothetical protein